jgi:hypothetical protein
MYYQFLGNNRIEINGPIPIQDQVRGFLHIWPTLGGDGLMEYFNRKAKDKSLPDWVEGWFAVPNPKFFGRQDPLTEMLKPLERRGLMNQIHPDLVRRKGSAAALQQYLGEQEGNDLLCFPAQFGMRNAGQKWSDELLHENSVALGVYEVAAMLIVHEDRLTSPFDLQIGCAGDEYGADASMPTFWHCLVPMLTTMLIAGHQIGYPTAYIG